MHEATEPDRMARRALLTERERELIASDTDENHRYVAISRVRRKITDELPQDVQVLAEHHPKLLSELRAVVCDTENAGSSEGGDDG